MAGNCNKGIRHAYGGTSFKLARLARLQLQHDQHNQGCLQPCRCETQFLPRHIWGNFDVDDGVRDASSVCARIPASLVDDVLVVSYA